jgi:hypothetical protein
MNSKQFDMGYTGPSSLLLTDDAQLNDSGYTNFAYYEGSVFTGTVNSHAVWTSSDTVFVGYRGSATLEVAGESRLSFGALQAGYPQTGVSSITVKENASFLVRDRSSSYLGESGIANLALKDNATFETQGDLYVAASGTANITLSGSAHFMAHMIEASSGNGKANSTTLHFEENGQLAVTGRFSTGNVGGSDIGDGYGDDYAESNHFALNVTFSAERLDGLAYITADEVVLHGTTTLGLDAFTNMAAGDTLTLLLIDSDAFAGAFDTVLVDGSTVLNWAESSTGIFTFEDANGFGYTLDYTIDSGHDVQLTVVAPVPEPGTWAMMLGGLGVLALARRRAVAL